MLRLVLWLILLLAIPLEAPTIKIQEESGASLGYPTGVVQEALVGLPMKAETKAAVAYSDTWDEHACLAHNIYFEARGEGDIGMKLIAQVTLNRVKSKKKYMKNTICEVVKTKGSFQWYSDGKSDRPTEHKAWERAKVIATRAMNGEFKNLTSSTYFKVCDYESGFFNKLKLLHRYRRHCFYTSD